MATMAVPDRTQADMGLLPDTAANGSPSFPFHVCHRNGYFALSPAVTADPAVSAQVVFTPPVAWRDANGSGCDTFLAAIEDGDIRLVISPCGIIAFDGNDLTAAGGIAVSPGGGNEDFRFKANVKHRMVISCDASSLTVGIYDDDTGEILAGTSPTVITGATPQFANFSGSPTILLGYPTKAYINSGYAGEDGHVGLYPAEGMIIHSMSAEVTGPTNITLTNSTVKAAKESGYAVGRLQTVHPTDLDGFNYTLVAGTGDTNNANFRITGNLLTKYGSPAAGSKSIRVQTKDKFGKTYAKALTVTVV